MRQLCLGFSSWEMGSRRILQDLGGHPRLHFPGKNPGAKIMAAGGTKAMDLGAKSGPKVLA